MSPEPEGRLCFPACDAIDSRVVQTKRKLANFKTFHLSMSCHALVRFSVIESKRLRKRALLNNYILNVLLMTDID